MRDITEIERLLDTIPTLYYGVARPPLPKTRKKHTRLNGLLLGLFIVIGSTIIVSATASVYISNQATTTVNVASEGVLVEQRLSGADPWVTTPLSISTLIGTPVEIDLRFTNVIAPTPIPDTTIRSTIHHSGINDSCIHDLSISIGGSTYTLKTVSGWSILPGFTHIINGDDLEISIAGIPWSGSSTPIEGSAGITFSYGGTYDITTSVLK